MLTIVKKKGSSCKNRKKPQNKKGRKNFLLKIQTVVKNGIQRMQIQKCNSGKRSNSYWLTKEFIEVFNPS